MNRIYIILSLFLSLCLILFFTSCSDDKDVITEFPYTGNLKITAEYTLPLSPLVPMRSCVSGNFFIVQDNNSVYNYNVYILPDFKKGFKAGFTGRGPDEFIFSPETLSPTPGDGSFEAYENNSGLLKRFVFEDEHLKFTEETRLPTPDGILGNRLSRLKKDIYLCANDFVNPEKEIVWLDTDKKTDKTIIDYPKFMREYAVAKDKQLLFISNAKIVPKPNGSKFGIFSLYYKYFRLFDGDGNLIREVKVNIKPYMDYNTREDIFRFAYYYNAAASDDYIYVICVNFEVGNKINVSEIQVWDWDGNPIARYECGEMLTYSCISLNDMKIYSLHYLNEERNEMAVRIYDIPALPD